MNRIQKIVLGFTLCIIGGISLLNGVGLLQTDYENSYYYLLQFLGLIFVFTSMGKNQRAILFLGSVLFMAGTIFFIKDNYEILDYSKIVIPSVLICFGTGFFLLYIDNIKESAFLVLSLVIFSVALFTITFTKDFPVIKLANRVSYNILGFWPALLLLLGVGLLLNRNRK